MVQKYGESRIVEKTPQNNQDMQTDRQADDRQRLGKGVAS